MTPEEKKLLLIDLCARLPHGVKVQITNDWFYDKTEPYNRRLDCDVIKSIRANKYTVKPYLRPMLSMTEEEEIYYNTVYTTLKFYEKEDWLNAHHFDFRSLIPLGLALEAPKDMYKQ
jgi:hypothetical protein